MLKISRAALVAAMLSVPALPLIGVAPAYAQDSADVKSSLSIPTITLVDSSMDEAALRDALSGGFMKHVSELAGLNATSITIPEIKFTSTDTVSGKTVSSSGTIKNVVLTNVRNGVADSASFDGITSEGEDATVEFGKFAATSVDFGGILALYSLVPVDRADQTMKVLYRSAAFEGGTLTSPTINCTLGKMTAGAFSARPLKVSFAELEAASEQMRAAGGTPPPEAMTTVFTFLTDMFQAFKSDPATVDGLSCKGTGATGDAFEIGLGGLSIDAQVPGTYPAISVDKVTLGDGGKNSITLDAATLKSIDFSGPIAAIQSAGNNLTEAWFATNARSLIPAFAGFSLSGLKADVENPDLVGERIKASIGTFDLTLGNYINGIPTQVATAASDVEVPLPSDPQDETAAMLKALGIERVNLSYKVDANWDKTSQTINVGTVEVSGVDLGRIAVSANIANASEMLFNLNPQMAIMASSSLTVKTLTFEVTDDGMGNIILPAAAKQQNMDLPTFRTQMGAALEGMAIQLLGSTDAARSLGEAISEFVSGAKKTLSITVTAKAPAGVPLQLLAQLGNTDDPMKLGPTLVGLVDVTGSAK